MSDDRHESISRRAYELWEKDGGSHGRHEEHWNQASREVGEPAPSTLAPDGTTIGDGSGSVDAGAAKRKPRSSVKGVSKAEPADSPAAAPPTIETPEASAEPADTPVASPAGKTRKTKTK